MKLPVIELSASYDICAAHILRRKDWTEDQNKEVFGHCSQLHGHQYKLEVVVTGALNAETGMVINGYTVDSIVKQVILSQMDHKFLNEDIDFFKSHLPTAEWISVWAFQELKGSFPQGCALKKVRIYETPALYAEYGED